MKIVQPCSGLCFLLGLAIFFPSSSPAQIGAEAWMRRYGTIKNSWGQFNKVVTDSMGNVIVAGYVDTGVTGYAGGQILQCGRAAVDQSLRRPGERS